MYHSSAYLSTRVNVTCIHVTRVSKYHVGVVDQVRVSVEGDSCPFRTRLGSVPMGVINNLFALALLLNHLDT
jgi:hypothetical protein